MSSKESFLAVHEALNRLVPGGRWDVQAALDVASGAQANLILGLGYRGIIIYPDHKIYALFDTSAETGINTANDLILEGAKYHSFVLPYDIGQQSVIKGVVLHVKQVGTSYPSTVRVILI